MYRAPLGGRAFYNNLYLFTKIIIITMTQVSQHNRKDWLNYEIKKCFNVFSPRWLMQREFLFTNSVSFFFLLLRCYLGSNCFPVVQRYRVGTFVQSKRRGRDRIRIRPENCEKITENQKVRGDFFRKPYLPISRQW